MGTITMIPAKRRIGSRVVQDEIPKTRVAAYCRVSTDTDEQAAKWYHRMDDVYFKWGLTPALYRVIRRNYDDVTPSDHWPVTVEFIVD